MCEVFYCDIEVAITSKKILLLSKILNGTIKVPKAVIRNIELRMHISCRKIYSIRDVYFYILRFHLQSLKILDPGRVAPLDIQTIDISK